MKSKVFAAILLFSCVAQCQVSYLQLKREIVEARLQRVLKDNNSRKTMLQTIFKEAGCVEGLTEQQVKGSRLPNVICTLPGTDDTQIIVGAHFDKVNQGTGVVDNWSGASLLPSLFESLNDKKRKHTFVFVGFTDEELGMVGLAVLR